MLWVCSDNVGKPFCFVLFRLITLKPKGIKGGSVEKTIKNRTFSCLHIIGLHIILPNYILMGKFTWITLFNIYVYLLLFMKTPV